MKRHTILFLAANPSELSPLALDREARAIQVELERAGFRDHFELVTRWAAEPLDLLRELRRLQPTVLHFSGHGTGTLEAGREQSDSRRDAIKPDAGDQDHGLYFQGPDGRPRLVSHEAIATTFGAAGASVKVVVLNACYSEQATALVDHVDCVVGMAGGIDDTAARSFAIGFYGGLAERASVEAAYKQGCAAVALEGMRHEARRPQLRARAGVDPSRLVLVAA